MATNKSQPADVPEQGGKKKPTRASVGVKARLAKKPNDELTFKPDGTDKAVLKYIKRRIEDMIDFRKGLGIEEKWREADEEYIPHELDFGTTRKRFETDQDTGLRSRMVPVGDISQQWRSASSAPTLLAKIQTAVSIMIDQQPEADLVALEKKFYNTTALAYSLWKRNWQITNAKEKLKILIFDLIKYGWGAKRTYPRRVEYDKMVLVETDPENPENDKYEEKKILWFNDVDRQNLDVFTTWIDELAKPYDPYSTNEAYYELDYSYDAAEVEFSQYPNWVYVKEDSQMVRNDEKRKNNRSEPQNKLLRRKDVVTIGFFQSRHKDMLTIWVPKDSIILYKGPLPNDDGYLDITHTLWLLRRSNMPYGVSLWEVIRQNKQLYDKMKNMTMDQLVLSIMKFGFHTGTQQNVGDGKIEIVPGQSRQVTTASGSAKDAFNWMEIPGPGQESWKGLEFLQDAMDDDSGISPSLEGEITGKTLGEILHAKDASLKRMKVPVENISWEIEQDAYLTLSWMGQLYSIPTVQQFTSEQEMMDFEKEEQITHVGPLFATPQTNEDGSPQQDEETGRPQLGAPYHAQYYPQIALHLENSDGQMTESKESKFYQIGKDILPGQLKWRGIFKVIPRSIIDTNQDLMKAMHMEIFNMLIPLLQLPPETAARPAQEILRDNELDPKDWLPDAWIDYLENGPKPAPQTPQIGAMGEPMGTTPGAPPAPGGAPAGPAVAPSAAPGSTIQGASGMVPPQAATIVPGNDMPNIAQMLVKPGQGGLFNKRMR